MCLVKGSSFGWGYVSWHTNLQSSAKFVIFLFFVKGRKMFLEDPKLLQPTETLRYSMFTFIYMYIHAHILTYGHTAHSYTLTL